MSLNPNLSRNFLTRNITTYNSYNSNWRHNDKVVASVRGAAAAELTLWAYAVGGGAARDVNRATMKELLIIKEVIGEFLFDSLLRPLDEINLVPLLK